MSNIKLTCQDCGEEFIFSERDQQFYKEKGFETPKRCRYCRQKKKERRENYGNYKKIY